jgi:hypothetical protein
VRQIAGDGAIAIIQALCWSGEEQHLMTWEGRGQGSETCQAAPCHLKALLVGSLNQCHQCMSMLHSTTECVRCIVMVAMLAKAQPWVGHAPIFNMSLCDA